MIKQIDNFECDPFSGSNQNKYTVFEGISSFLDSVGICWEHMFQLFRKSSDGYLTYSFGDLEISFRKTEDFTGEDEDVEDVIELSIESKKGNLEKKSNYTYRIEDLAQLRKTEQSKMDSFRESRS